MSSVAPQQLRACGGFSCADMRLRGAHVKSKGPLGRLPVRGCEEGCEYRIVMGAARQQRWAPAPVALPSFAPELQPLRLLVAPPVGQLVLALRDGRSLYACDVSAESTRGGQPAAAALLSHHEPPVCALTFIRQRGRLFLVALQARKSQGAASLPAAMLVARIVGYVHAAGLTARLTLRVFSRNRRTRPCAHGTGPPHRC